MLIQDGQGGLNRKIVLILAHKGRFFSSQVIWWNSKVQYHLVSNVDVLDICLLCALWHAEINTLPVRTLYALYTHFNRHFEISKCHFGIQK